MALPDLKLTPDERKVLETAIDFLEKKIDEREGEVVRREKEEARKEKEERALTEAEQLWETYERREKLGERSHKEEERMFRNGKSQKDIWSDAKTNFGKIWGKGQEGCSMCVKSLKEKGIKEADSLCKWLQSFEGGN